MIETDSIKLKTKTAKFYDITDKVESIVKKSGIKDGICQIFCPGSTGAIIINENDPSLLLDLNKMLEKAANQGSIYHHAENAWSHIHATILGPEKSVPIKNGKLALGQWQSILFRECDKGERSRDIIVNVIGE